MNIQAILVDRKGFTKNMMINNFQKQIKMLSPMESEKKFSSEKEAKEFIKKLKKIL